MDEAKIGLPVDQELKQRFLDFYSEWIDIKYEQFGLIPRLPQRIWDFACGDVSFQLHPPECLSADSLLSYHQREFGNVRNAWRLLCNWEANPYHYLESSLAWDELLKRYISRQGLRSKGDDFLDQHLVLQLNQDQHNILHEMELVLNPAITCVVSMADKLAYVFVCILNDLFPEQTRMLYFIDPAQPDRILDTQLPPDVKVGKVYKVLAANKDRYKLDQVLEQLSYFVSDDFRKLREYRNDYIHQFPQRVGYPDQPIQLISDYVDIAQKRDPKRKGPYNPIHSEFSMVGTESQHWTHEALLQQTHRVWNGTIEKITTIFDILVNKEAK